MKTIFYEKPFKVSKKANTFDRAISISKQVDKLLDKYGKDIVIEFTGSAAEQWLWANSVFNEASRASR